MPHSLSLITLEEIRSMNAKSNPLSLAVRYGLVVGAAGVLGLTAAPTTSFAQSGEEAVLDKIEVLGSRIRRAEGETALPVLSIERAELERTGLTQVADILRELSINGPSLSLNTNNGNTSGNSSVNLRNCASNLTLVLVNGRRWVSNNGLGGAVDLGSIPTSAIERIEVLKDGASALYGSDALCGVINIQTRTSFDGAEARAYYGQFEQGDGQRESYDFTVGGSGERFSTLLNVALTEQKAVMAGDREIAAVPLFGFPATVSSPGRASPSGPYGQFPVSGRTLTLDPSQAGCLLNQNCRDIPGIANAFRPYNFLTDGYNFAPDNYLSQPQKTRSLFGQARYDIFDNVRFRTEVFYTHRLGTAQLAAQPLSPLTVSAQSVYNPFGVNITGANFRPINFPRVFGQEQDTWRFSGAFDGEFELGSRYFYWDVGYTYAENRQLQPKNGFYFTTRVNQALGPSFIDATTGIARCGTAAAPIAGCVPMNIFGGPAGFTAEMFNYVAVNPKNVQKSTQETYSANLSGDLFELPAGSLAFAAGIEHRNESGSSEPDPLTAAGLVLGDNPFLPTVGSYYSNEVFAELQIPVLRDAPLAQSLEFSLAGRYSDYNTFGSTTNPKASFRWQPIDQLLVRGSWGEGFRAPSISDLYSGVGGSRPAAQDPCSATSQAFIQSAAVRAACAAAGVPAGYVASSAQTRASVGGSPTVQPETSVSKTLGIVYSPSWADGLDLYVDWYNIKIENQIGSPSAQGVLNQCYVSGQTDACQRIRRDITGSIYGNPGEVDDIVLVTRNFKGGLETEGFDFGANYRFDLDSWGSFLVRWDSTYVSYYGDVGKPSRNTINRDGDITLGNLVGRLPSNSSAGAPRHRLRSQLATNWTLGDFSTTLTFEYRSRVRESCNNVFNTATALGNQVNPSFFDLRNLCSNPDYTVDVATFRPGTNELVFTPARTPVNMLGGVTYTHLQTTWSAPWNAKITAGARNLFDKDPPFSSDAFANSYDAQYLIPGRFYYLSYQQNF